MASYPPYPPPAGSPFGFDPKRQRQFARQQMKDRMRAQKAAMRAQRDLYRYQARAMRRSSILGPLMVVLVGVNILLVSSGRVSFPRFAAWYGAWWPLLLVAAGVVLVGEWALDQRPRANGSAPVHRGFGAGTAFLLTLIAISGIVIRAVNQHGETVLNAIHLNTDDFSEFYGERHDLPPQTVDQAFPEGRSLLVENPHGDVTIAGTSTDGRMHLTLSKRVFGWSNSSAAARADHLDASLFLAGDTLHVAIPAVDAAISDLAITLPAGAGATVNADHGAVTVSSLRGPVSVTANHGDVEIDTITGDVATHLSQHGSSFTAHGITGQVTVRGHAQDLNITDVTGPVSLEGEFYGDTHLEHLHGPLTFRTTRTQLSLVRLDGEVDISPNSELTGSEMVGPTQLKTRSRNISFDGIAGDVNVTNSDGSVDIVSKAPLGNVTVENRNGAIDLTVPEHSAFTLDAEAKGGSIDNEVELKSVSEKSNSTLRGTVGAGTANISLRTSHFDIGLHEKNVAPLP